MNSNEVTPGADLTHVARVYRKLPITPAQLHVKADFTTYDISITDDENTSVFNSTGNALAVGDPIIDSSLPQWDLDANGYNFQHTVRAVDMGANAVKGGRTYTTVYTLHGIAAYGDVKLDFINPCKSLQGV